METSWGDEYIQEGYLPQRLNLNKGIARGMIELYAFDIWQLYKFQSQIIFF